MAIERRGASKTNSNGAKGIRKKGARRTADRGLNRATVVAAALDEIDRNGLESFSLRSLAKSLGIFPTAVTWHVTDRSELLAEVVRLVLEDISPPGFHDSWQGYLRQV